MDIGSEKIDKLLELIEEFKKRKIVDISEENIQFIDPRGNLAKLKAHNCSLILGRRGSGKTTIQLVSMKNNVKDIPVAVDCQSIRRREETDIIIYLLIKVLEKIRLNMQNESYKEIREKYRAGYGGIEGIIKWFTEKKQHEETKQQLIRCQAFLDMTDDLIKSLKVLENHPNQVTYTTNFVGVYTKETNEQSKIDNQLNVETILEGELGAKYKGIGAKIKTVSGIVSNLSHSLENTFNQQENYEVQTENVKVVKKDQLINDLVDGITELFNEYKEIEGKHIVLYLDDFYQIPREKHPRIIHYFHDIFKNCVRGSFCYKICSIPNSLTLNYEGEAILSPIHDYTTITLDFDLSDMNRVIRYLLEITSSLDKDLEISTSDIENLFGSDSLLYTVIATGGIPRDFLLMLGELIRIIRANGKDKIIREDIYLASRELEKDKGESIEYDANITPELIESTKIKIHNEIVEKHKTNVFLYPNNPSPHEEAIIRNLVNARYLHIIKESVSSENAKKKLFNAYLVDMSLYATGKRLRPNFKLREFWRRDDKSRIKDLDSAPIIYTILDPVGATT
jgi:hypothetical protein